MARRYRSADRFTAAFPSRSITIGRYVGLTLEQFEIEFMRDMHPQKEVALWFRIAKAWLA